MNPAHSRGRHKARVFKSALGYDEHNYDSLRSQIESQVLDLEAKTGAANKHGKRYVVDVPINGPSGKEVMVRTGWLISLGTKQAHLTTLFVRKQP